MRFLSLCTAALCAALLLASTARADPSERRGRRGIPPQLREKLLEKFDANGDGKLDETEREAAKAAMQAKRAERKAEILERFDADGDGQLNEQEKAAAKEAFKAKMKERFDANGDGELDATERRALKRAMRRHQRMRHRHGGGDRGGERRGPVTPN
jgi:hypothetical protein